MSAFRKKPVVIQAEQWFPGKEVAGVEELDPETATARGLIHTLEGDMVASSGDWIITGIRGEKYPCKPDIFEATYEAVE